MCKTNIHKKEKHGQNNMYSNVEKESVQQLSDYMPLSLNAKFVEELEKKLRDFLAQLGFQVVLLKRVYALALGKA